MVVADDSDAEALSEPLSDPVKEPSSSSTSEPFVKLSFFRELRLEDPSMLEPNEFAAAAIPSQLPSSIIPSILADFWRRPDDIEPDW